MPLTLTSHRCHEAKIRLHTTKYKKAIFIYLKLTNGFRFPYVRSIWICADISHCKETSRTLILENILQKVFVLKKLDLFSIIIYQFGVLNGCKKHDYTFDRITIHSKLNIMITICYTRYIFGWVNENWIKKYNVNLKKTTKPWLTKH